MTKHFPGGSVNNLPVNAGDARDAGAIPGSARSPGGGNGNLLQYPCLEIPWARSLVDYSPQSRKESEAAEHTGGV